MSNFHLLEVGEEINNNLVGKEMSVLYRYFKNPMMTIIGGLRVVKYVNGRPMQRAIRSARWSFLKNKLSESLEQKKSKPL